MFYLINNFMQAFLHAFCCSKLFIIKRQHWSFGNSVCSLIFFIVINGLILISFLFAKVPRDFRFWYFFMNFHAFFRIYFFKIFLTIFPLKNTEKAFSIGTKVQRRIWSDHEPLTAILLLRPLWQPCIQGR